MNSDLKNKWLALSEADKAINDAYKKYKNAYNEMKDAIETDMIKARNGKDGYLNLYDFDQCLIGGSPPIYPLPETLQDAVDNYNLLKQNVINNSPTFYAVQKIKEKQMAPEELLAKREDEKVREKLQEEMLVKEKQQKENAPVQILNKEINFTEKDIFNEGRYFSDVFVNVITYEKDSLKKICLSIGDDCDSACINLTEDQLQNVIYLLNDVIYLLNNPVIQNKDQKSETDDFDKNDDEMILD